MEGLRILTRESTSAKVYRIRTSLSLSQRELASKLGVSKRTVIRWEAGARVHPVFIDRLNDMLREKEPAHA